MTGLSAVFTHRQPAIQASETLHDTRAAREPEPTRIARYGNGYHVETPPEPELVPVYKRRGPELFKAAVFDIEVSDFKTEGDEGILICCCIQPLNDDEPITLALRYEDEGDDRRLVVETLTALNEYSILIGHNIRRFDLAWLKSRLIYHNIACVSSWYYVDTFFLAQGSSLKTSKSLGNLVDFFGLDGEKTTIYPTSWSGARSRKRDRFTSTMSDVIYHCRQDVIANRNLFWRLWPLQSDTSQPQLKRYVLNLSGGVLIVPPGEEV